MTDANNADRAASEMESLVERARELTAAQRFDEAEDCLAQVIGRADDSLAVRDDVRMRVVAVDVRIALGWLFDAQDRIDDALSSFDVATSLIGESEDPELRAQQVFARHGKASLLNASASYEEASLVVAEMINTVAEDPPPGTDTCLADGYLIAGNLAYRFQQPSPAIQLYDELVRLYGAHEDSEVRETVGRALVSKAAILGQTGRIPEAIAVCDELVARIAGDSPDCDLPAVLAFALSDKGVWLQQTGRIDEAVASYRAVLDRFTKGEDPEVDERLALAREQLRVLTDTER